MADVLLVDDEPDFVAAATAMLRMHNHCVETADSLAGARRSLSVSIPDALLLDLILPDGNGLELLDELADSPLEKVVLITGHPGIKSHIKALSGPAVSYLTKPIDSDALIKSLLGVGTADAAPSVERPHFGLMVGEHPRMHEVYSQIERVAKTSTPVLILGETGTGKELVAESLHRASGRDGDFVEVNCGSLSKDLAGSELFGHEKGSFTGAVRRHSGFFKRADGGTLFLDELTEMPIELQAHFLRVLETGRVLSVGSDKESVVQSRIVAATNRDPEQAIADSALRQDLFFRLSVFPIVLPPLRDRASDIPRIVEHVLGQSRPDADERRFSAEALERLKAYHWPGNVRELKHVVQRACIMSPRETDELQLPERFDSPFGSVSAPSPGLRPGRSIRDVEQELIEQTLEHFGGDKKAAAEILGISLNTLYSRLNSYQNRGR